MPHYLFQASYTSQSWAALVKKPENRRLAIARLVESAGGKLESFYFAFGATDAFVTVELPDNVAAGGVAAAVAASGGVSSLTTTVLMTSEEGEQVMRKAGQIAYALPGSQ
jgi:uncharacterized protein with GYD domain